MAETRVRLHFFVNRIEVTTDREDLTGAEIKALAGADPTDLLELRDGPQRIPIQNGELVRVRGGQHYVTYPGGRDS
jgi:Multiubiquitin